MGQSNLCYPAAVVQHDRRLIDWSQLSLSMTSIVKVDVSPVEELCRQIWLMDWVQPSPTLVWIVEVNAIPRRGPPDW